MLVWSKVIYTKFDTKQLKSQNMDYLKEMKILHLLKGPDAYT